MVSTKLVADEYALLRFIFRFGAALLPRRLVTILIDAQHPISAQLADGVATVIESLSSNDFLVVLTTSIESVCCITFNAI